MSHSEEKQPPSPSDSVLKTEEPVHIESGNARPSAVTHQVDLKKADAAVAILGDPTIVREVTPEENRKVLRKIDFWIMPVVVLVYMLQQLDKSSLSYTSVFGIVTDAHLHGTQYSWLTSIVYIAQLIWQPASSYMLVRFPLSKYLFVHVVMWGVCVASTAAAKNFSGLMAARFFLGLFEATIAPCFITITQMWWKRREQTFRLAMWMAANGGTGMFGSLLTYGLGHIHGSLRPYQVIFLFIGLLTIVLSPIVYFVLPDSPTKARFLNKEEKIIAVERLRSNNQGTETKIWKWEQVWDVVTDPKTYLFFIALVLCTIPSGGISAFGPLIIQGFGFDQFHTILFNIPFSALQVVLTLTAGHMAQVLKLKSAVLFFFCLPPIGAAAALLTLGRGPELRNTLLGCYYVVSFFTAIQPMLYTWSAQNTAGHTKKTCTTGIIFVAQCVGNIIGPLLYKTEDKPYYRKGLIANLVCWIALAIMVLVITAYLSWANKRHEQRRIALGKPGKVVDTSLDDGSKEKKITSEDGEVAANEQSFLDLTDRQNEDFIYVL